MGVEVYFRYFFDQTDNVFQIHTTERWADRHVTLNAFGFRDYHFFDEKDPKETRIAVLGDSFTWGYGIRNPMDRYSKILETKLASQCSDPTRIKTYAMGIPGRNTRDEFETLTKEASHFKFDSVVLGYYMDDASSEESVRHFQHCYQRVFSYRRIPILRTLIDRSFAIQYLWVRLYNSFIFPKYAQKCWDTNYASLYQDPEVWSKHIQMLGKIIEFTKSRHMGLSVVIFPFMNMVGPDYPARRPAQRLEQFFVDQKIPVVNLDPLLTSYRPKDVMVSPRDFHANELVNRIAADALYEKIKNLDTFQCKRS